MPLDLHHTVSDSGSISLAWSPPAYDGGSTVLGYIVYYQAYGESTWQKTVDIGAELTAYTVTSLTPDVRYALKIVARNIKGESERSHIYYQFASAVPKIYTEPSLIVSSRTDTSLNILMYAPGVSSTDVLGYQVYINEANTNAIPSILAYDGRAVSN